MLAPVRYLPSFCGRWEIELYPAWDNLVVLPLPLESTFGGNDDNWKEILYIGPLTVATLDGGGAVSHILWCEKVP
jgi:hypothetical protein